MCRTHCLRATEAAIVRAQVHGVYHLGDEQPFTLQQLLDVACQQWGCPRPYCLPLWAIMTAASLRELAALAAHTPSPLTRDIIRIGRGSYWGDTRRQRQLTRQFARLLLRLGAVGQLPLPGDSRSGSRNYSTPIDYTMTFTVGEVAPVPEPATLLLFGSGLLGLAARRRRTS